MGKDAEALDQFRAVLAAEPTSAIAHLDAGLSYYNLRQYEPAGKELNAAWPSRRAIPRRRLWLAKTLAQKVSLTRRGAVQPGSQGKPR